MSQDHLAVDLFTDEVESLFGLSSLYKKTVIIDYRVAEPEESLNTILKDGTVETKRILLGGEYIVKDPGGEEYALTEENFHSRYMKTGTGVFVSVGVVKAFVNPYRSPIKIMAPWGEIQFGKSDCLIALAENNMCDRYLIDREVFEEAYVLAE